ncbi:MAG: hypothetical protein JW990_16280 [Thermoleophilia bacterium]|nr:hypothetical protein [Thermoleophilia bacterium]
MASADEIFPVSDCCEICGAPLGDEVVFQEFADGSLARLCPECAAGADLSGDAETNRERAHNPESIWPDERDSTREALAADFDPLEKTRELLMPVTDLIALQGDIQAALQRLASSLERFAAEMITDVQGKTAVENRLKILEHELDKTRAKLSQTEFLLAAPASEDTQTGAPPDQSAMISLPLDTPDIAAPATLDEMVPVDTGPTTSAEITPAVEPPAAEPAAVEPAAVETASDWTAPDAAPPIAEPAAELVRPPAAEAEPSQPAGQAPHEHLPTFHIDEVQAAQRYYNESQFTTRVRDVRRSLGRPKANLTRLPGVEPRAIVTIAWDIVWYQYLVDMRRDLPSTTERVTLHREGMDLDELAFCFKEKNAVVNDDGRLDASELEVKLLSDPDALITEMTPEERHCLEDVTEEIWDQRIAPEFKWDD